MTIEIKRMTVEQFEAVADTPENADRLLELIDGEIVEKMPTEFHGIIVLNIGGELRAFVLAHDLGRVGVEIRHRHPDDPYNARIPDVSFTSKERLTEVVMRGTVPRLPDLAVEVKSPDDSYTQMRAKAAYFMANGSRMVWLIYPEKKLAEVYHRDPQGVETIQLLSIEESISGADVLPNFTLPLETIFKVD